ncbi:MAG: hypothetical protein WBO09_15140, partial [Methylocystis silviterrae]|uniref:hypothetical protein n=1 Tax=Methylocystis silviterrae TaxID=2743612 RepID=UPI003C7252FE
AIPELRLFPLRIGVAERFGARVAPMARYRKRCLCFGSAGPQENGKASHRGRGSKLLWSAYET